MIVSASATQDQELQPKKASLFEGKLLAFYEEKQFQHYSCRPRRPAFWINSFVYSDCPNNEKFGPVLKTLLNWAMFMTEAKDRKGEREKKEMFVKAPIQVS